MNVHNLVQELSKFYEHWPDGDDGLFITKNTHNVHRIYYFSTNEMVYKIVLFSRGLEKVQTIMHSFESQLQKILPELSSLGREIL